MSDHRERAEHELGMSAKNAGENGQNSALRSIAHALLDLSEQTNAVHNAMDELKEIGRALMPGEMAVARRRREGRRYV